MFETTLRREDRDFLLAHRGLGNSQKAEVAWLEKRFEETGNAGYLYEEIDVRNFSAARSAEASAPARSNGGLEQEQDGTTKLQQQSSRTLSTVSI
jgi:hypothetical protein